MFRLLLKTYAARFSARTNTRTDKIKKTKNKILAISMAEPAMAVNPNSAATIAIMKNVAAQYNMVSPFLKLSLSTRQFYFS